MKQKITLEIQNDTGVEFEDTMTIDLVSKGQYYYSTQRQKIARADRDICVPQIVLTPTVDTELEDNRKRFPVDSWVKQAGLTNTTILYKVREVTRENVADGHFPVVVHCHDRSFFPLDCVPFPLPTWRCCESDKPKRGGKYFTRLKGTHEEKEVDVYCFRLDWNCRSVEISNYEWLDDGGL